MNTLRELNTNYIDGVWRAGLSGQIYENRDPYTGDVVSSITLADARDIDAAYKAAARAQKEWVGMGPWEQSRILENAITVIEKYENNGELSDLIAAELGGNRLKAGFETFLTKNIIKEAATYPQRMDGYILPGTIPGKENRLYRIPVGVVGVISPSNFPLFLTMKMVVAALGAGNGVVLKPNENTYISGGLFLAKVFEEAGLPPGLLNVVVTTVELMGDSFIAHDIVSAIAFTGSSAAGSQIAALAGKHLKDVALELGGNSAFIVLDDADIDYAVNAAVFSRFTHQGQICMCGNRILVANSVYDEFVEKFVKKVKTLKAGDPRNEDTIIGPLITERQTRALLATVDAAVEQGAEVLYRGEVRGNVVEPIVLAGSNALACAREEMFGPAVVIVRFEDDEDAITIANDTKYGLSGAVHTANLERGAELAKRIETGMIHINDTTINDEPLIAFGGEKHSGVGRFNGRWALEKFTTLKWISVQHTKRVFPY